MTQTRFIPCDDGEGAPARIDSLPDVETPERVELNGLPIGTIVQFYGAHSASKYICKIVGSEEEKRIKVWFKGNIPSAIAPLEEIISCDLRNTLVECGVIETGKNYVLPHFWYKDINTTKPTLIIDSQLRTEPYRRIFVKKPSLKESLSK